MKKLIILLIVAAAGGIFYWSQKPSSIIVKNTPTNTSASPSDYKNISYDIEGQTIQLKNGSAEMDASPGSVEKISTQYFGNEVKGDFNNDGIPDLAFVLTQDGGGTGVFYYVVAALQNSKGGYTGTNAIFLGDRIAPKTGEFRNSQIIVNYADRKPGEPFSTDPSVAVSKYLKVNGRQLLEVSP